MTYVSLWEWLLLRLGLMPAGRAQALLRGRQPALHPQSALLLKGLSAAAVVIGIVGAYTASLIGSGLLDRRGLWESGAAARARWKASGGGAAAGHEARRRFVESTFSPEARRAIQRVHDRLQLRYGDDVYRNAFKPAVAREAFGAFLSGLASGRFASPDQYLRELTPEDIARLSTMALGDLDGDLDGAPSPFQRVGEVDQTLPRPAPSVIFIDPHFE